MLIETTRFRLAEHTSDDAFWEADAEAQTVFAYQQPGLVRRTTSISDDGWWMVVALWYDRPHADAAAEAAGQDETTRRWFELIDPDSIRIERYETPD